MRLMQKSSWMQWWLEEMGYDMRSGWINVLKVAKWFFWGGLV